MSSKRGRKRNDNLPPNRARDVQRAFRARRAAHLLALEGRVSELEAENAKLRKIVGWPPDDRPSLGKGPTGKDKPKPPDGGGGTQAIDFFESESAESSSRRSSLSPSAIPGPSSRPMHVIDPQAWDALTLGPHDQTPDSPYQLPPLEPPAVIKSEYTSYAHPLPSSLPSSLSRSPVPPSANPTMYLNAAASYSHTGDRALGGSYSSPSFVARGTDMQVDSSRQQYTYHQGSYRDQGDQGVIHPHTPPPPSSHPQQQSHMNHRDNIPVPVPYTHRRAVTDYNFGQSLHLPHPAQMHPEQGTRQLDTRPIHDASQQHQHQHQQQQQHVYRMSYTPDGRINSMP